MPERIAGVKAKVMDVLDRGNSRSIADVLKLAHGQAVQPTVVAAICAMIPRILVSAEKWNAKMTLSQTLAVLSQYKDGIQFVLEHRPTTPTLRTAQVTAAVVIAHAVEPKKTEEFYEQFRSGIGLTATSPVLNIRNHCINGLQPAGGQSISRVWTGMLVLHSIHAFIHNLKIDRFPRENFRKTKGQEFIDRQPEKAAAIQKMFPRFDNKITPITTATNWKSTPAIDSLLRGKDMSDRAHARAAQLAQRRLVQ